MDVEESNRAHVFADTALLLAACQALLEGGEVQSRLLGVAGQRIRAERPLIGEQKVVHLPELPLIVRAGRGLGGLHRVRMHP